jgi:hypothetical protein
MVIQAFIKWPEEGLDLCEITDPTGMWINLTFNVDGNPEGVTVQATTFVTSGYVRKIMGGFEGELFE